MQLDHRKFCENWKEHREIYGNFLHDVYGQETKYCRIIYRLCEKYIFVSLAHAHTGVTGFSPWQRGLPAMLCALPGSEPSNEPWVCVESASGSILSCGWSEGDKKSKTKEKEAGRRKRIRIIKELHVDFKVFKTVTMKTAIFCDVKPCGSIIIMRWGNF
jgi:hypothetical protein